MNEKRWQGERDKLLALPHPCLMLVTEAMEQSRLLTIVQAAVAGGVDIVQVRNKSQTPQQLLETATTLKSSLPKTLMVVNGYQEETCIGAIDGIHLP